MNICLIFCLLNLQLLAAACGRSAAPTNSATNANRTNASPSATTDLELQKQIAEIAKDAKGKVGVYAVLIETGETVSLNANEHFAMQSVVKLPISMAVMKLAQEGKLDLEEKVGISKDELVPSNMRSPIRDKNPNGGEMSVRDLIRYAISESDGTAADVLQRVAGGANGVQSYVDSIGVKEMEIKHSHKEFGAKWELQYENWATPEGAISLLRALWTASSGNNSRLGVASDTRKVEAKTIDMILDFMVESNNPPNRIKGLLPKDTVVAHKTGSGGTRDGITSATNDVGIVRLPNGDYFAIAVFVGDSSADLQTRKGVIAKIARAVWDKWSRPKTSENTNGVTPANFSDRHSLY